MVSTVLNCKGYLPPEDSFRDQLSIRRANSAVALFAFFFLKQFTALHGSRWLKSNLFFQMPLPKTQQERRVRHVSLPPNLH